jgi:hypothetical protein
MFAGSVIGVAYQDSPQLIAGVVWSEVALSYTNDWIEFHVTNNEYTLYVTVDALNDLANNPSFPNYKFRIAQGSSGGPVVLGPTTVSNLTTPVLLSASVPYYLEFTSGTPLVVGQSDLQLLAPNEDPRVATPLPAAFGLFGSVLGLGGLLMRRRWAAQPNKQSVPSIKRFISAGPKIGRGCAGRRGRSFVTAKPAHAWAAG